MTERSVRTAREPRRDPELILLEANEVMTGADPLGAEARTNRVKQDDEQLAAMDRILRPAIAGGAAAWFRPDQLAVFVVVGERRRFDRGLGERIAQTELGELAHCIGLQVDADAERAQRDDELIDAAINAGGVQAERRGQPADATADNENLHGLYLPSAVPPRFQPRPPSP